MCSSEESLRLYDCIRCSDVEGIQLCERWVANVPTNHGFTPARVVMVPMVTRRIAVLEALLALGTDVTVPFKKDFSILVYVAQENRIGETAARFAGSV
jgi:hypothetical protein